MIARLLSNKHGTHYQDYFKLMSNLIEAGEKEISREKDFLTLTHPLESV